MISLLRVVTGEAHTLAAHAGAYAELAGDEFAAFGQQWSRRAMAWAIAGASAFLALGLGGVALMLWAVMPDAGSRSWLLIVVPALPAVTAVGAWMAARRRRVVPPFAELRAQVEQDLALLQESLAR